MLEWQELAGSARLAVDYISDHCTTGVDPTQPSGNDL